MNQLTIELSNSTMDLLRREAEALNVPTATMAASLLTTDLILRDLDREAEELEESHG